MAITGSSYSNLTALPASERESIEAEHERLARFISDLCETCSDFETSDDCHHCSKEKTAACQGRLPSFFYDFRDLVAEHFENEERIMGDLFQSESEQDYLRQHRNEHQLLMQQVEGMIQASAQLSRQGNAAAAIREFHQLITARFGEHARDFDDFLLGAQ